MLASIPLKGEYTHMARKYGRRKAARIVVVVIILVVLELSGKFV